MYYFITLLHFINLLDLLHYHNIYILHYPYNPMTKKTQSFRVDPKLWKDVKVYVAKNGSDISSFLESAIKDRLRK